jgi:hypothetical protein
LLHAASAAEGLHQSFKAAGQIRAANPSSFQQANSLLPSMEFTA